MRCSPNQALFWSPQACKPRSVRWPWFNPQRIPAPAIQRVSLGRLAGSIPKHAATAATSSNSSNSLMRQRCCGKRSNHCRAAISGLLDFAPMSAISKGIKRGSVGLYWPKTALIAGAMGSISGTITMTSRGFNAAGAPGPKGAWANSCSNWSCRISSSRTGLWAR